MSGENHIKKLGGQRVEIGDHTYLLRQTAEVSVRGVESTQHVVVGRVPDYDPSRVTEALELVTEDEQDDIVSGLRDQSFAGDIDFS